DYVDAMHAHGLKVGFYFSMLDYTNGDSTGLPTIDFVEHQLHELLTEYGPVSLVWFDGWAWAPSITYARIPYDGIRDMIRDLQPGAVVLENNLEQTLAHSDVVSYERNIEGLPPADNQEPAEVADNIRADRKWFFSDGACGLVSADALATSFQEVTTRHANY